jgi:cellulose synthase/poly-beta-1,6-N-acetylglucosamine synthase-like glycosyltransferase
MAQSALAATRRASLSRRSSLVSAAESEEVLEEDFEFVRKAIRVADDMADTRAEFASLDYTPVTSIRPVDFVSRLRATRASRKIRLFICITAYNEDGAELRRTLTGIAANLPGLQRVGLHWSEIVVCVIIDGRERASASMIDYVTGDLQLYDPSLIVEEHRGNPTTMHLFERTVELTKSKATREYHFPLQVLLALKAANGGKLNSHLWCLSGFAGQLNPKYLAMLDVGTVPLPQALVRLYAAMEEDPECGGCCGEILVRNMRPWSMLDATQALEYCLSHLMDKATESLYGYIPVLPGAFSMYRWLAIRGEVRRPPPTTFPTSSRRASAVVSCACCVSLPDFFLAAIGGVLQDRGDGDFRAGRCVGVSQGASLARSRRLRIVCSASDASFSPPLNAAAFTANMYLAEGALREQCNGSIAGPGSYSRVARTRLVSPPSHHLACATTSSFSSSAAASRILRPHRADRILCFQIVARPNRRWLLRYISNAFAETDTPETLLELIKQRRRWLNG